MWKRKELKDKAKSYIGSITKLFGVPAGPWPGAQASWGNSRVWLEPAQETNTHGRTDLSIHGGWNYGSAGCIDLAPNMDDFKRMFQNHGNDIDTNQFPNAWQSKNNVFDGTSANATVGKFYTTIYTAGDPRWRQTETTSVK